MGYGSLQNLIAGNSAPEPEVGMGATEICWTDREPYTIIAVHSATRITVQRDDYKRTDGNGLSETQFYEFIPNPNGGTEDLRRAADGRWYTKGGKARGRRFVIGHRSKYHDFSF
jgi:hypothetical protein